MVLPDSRLVCFLSYSIPTSDQIAGVHKAFPMRNNDNPISKKENPGINNTKIPTPLKYKPTMAEYLKPYLSQINPPSTGRVNARE